MCMEIKTTEFFYVYPQETVIDFIRNISWKPKQISWRLQFIYFVDFSTVNFDIFYNIGTWA